MVQNVEKNESIAVNIGLVAVAGRGIKTHIFELAGSN
jgi:hypothetical protein